MTDLASLLSAAVQARADNEDKARLPMRQNWGPRPGSGELKDIGFYGPVQLSPGAVATEYSATGGFDGRERRFPLVAQNMPPHLLQNVMSAARFGGRESPEATQFAVDAAKQRMAAGRSPFFEQGRDPYPQWSPDQHWPEPAVMPRR